jgi:hypothetical protein
MIRSRPKSALLFLFLLLAPSLLCAAGSAPSPAGRDLERVSSPEGIRCFCHPRTAGEQGALRAADAPGPRVLYVPASFPTLTSSNAPELLELAEGAYRGEPRPEPRTPPPIVLS